MLVDREKRLVVFRAELGEPLGDDVHDRAWRQRRIEAAADAEVQREIVALAQQHARAPRRRRHHPDAGRQHVDLVTRRAP